MLKENTWYHIKPRDPAATLPEDDYLIWKISTDNYFRISDVCASYNAAWYSFTPLCEFKVGDKVQIINDHQFTSLYGKTVDTFKIFKIVSIIKDKVWVCCPPDDDIVVPISKLKKASLQTEAKKTGEALKSFRLSTLKMGIQQFASLLGVTPSSIYNVEHGRRFDESITINEIKILNL
jgi:DNA-binding XRE family transcriptional regulator